MKAGGDILPFEGWILMQNFLAGLADPEKFENGLNRYPLTTDRRLTVANIFIDRHSINNCIHNFHVCFQPVPN